MEQKINIAELLKDCPSGMELDCMIYDRVTFGEVTTVIGFDNKERVKIIVSTHYSDGTKDEILLTEYGTYTYDETAKCVIFPKGKTTWKGFVPPCKFKDGDVLTCVKESNPFIFHYDNGEFYDVHCALINDHLQIYKRKNNWVSNCRKFRLATEEEKAKLFQAIKDNGYHWNAETKTLEKLIEPKFKVGDRIRHKTTNKDDIYEISKVYDDCYSLVDCTWVIYMEHQDNWELVVEPKFKVGNRIVKRNSISISWIVSSVSSEYYGLKLPNDFEGVGILPVSKQDDWELLPNIKPKFKVGDTIQDEAGYKVKITEVNLEDECYGYESIIAKGIGGFAFSEQNNWKLVPDIEPKFKVGDKIRLKENHTYIYTITGIREKENKYECGVTFVLRFSEQDNWELAPNKFDITTLKPFESKVLVRDYDDKIWIPTFWGKLLEEDSNCRYLTTNGCYKYCIPYPSNIYLLGTTEDCEEYYKTWK